MAASSRDFQTAHGAGGGGEAVGFDAELLEHGDVEVRQRVVVLGIEGEVLAVPEAAAGEEDGQVGGDVAGAVHAAIGSSGTRHLVSSFTCRRFFGLGKVS